MLRAPEISHTDSAFDLLKRKGSNLLSSFSFGSASAPPAIAAVDHTYEVFEDNDVPLNLTLVASPTGFTVVAAVPETVPAGSEIGSVRLGDVLLAVNVTSTEGLSFSEVLAMVKAAGAAPNECTPCCSLTAP
jgi:hypothetical protein